MTPEQQKALAEFARWAISRMFETCYCDLEAEDIFNKAQQLKLLDQELYDPDKHGEQDCDPGEEIYFPARWIKEAAK